VRLSEAPMESSAPGSHGVHPRPLRGLAEQPSHPQHIWASVVPRSRKVLCERLIAEAQPPNQRLWDSRAVSSHLRMSNKTLTPRATARP